MARSGRERDPKRTSRTVPGIATLLVLALRLSLGKQHLAKHRNRGGLLLEITISGSVPRDHTQVPSKAIERSLLCCVVFVAELGGH